MNVLSELQSIDPLTVPHCWRPMRSELPWPDWGDEFVRVTKNISIDLTDPEAHLTFAEMAALCAEHSATVTIWNNPYHWGGYSNTDPTNTSQDAAHLAAIAAYIATIKASAMESYVSSVNLNTEVFSRADPNNAGNSAHNTALVAKFTAVYDLFKDGTDGWASARVYFYGCNAFVTGNQNGGYPADNWIIHPWSVWPGSSAAVHTGGTVTPFQGDAAGVPLYHPHEYEMTRLGANYTKTAFPSLNLVYYLSLGAAYIPIQPTDANFNSWNPQSGVYQAHSYPTAYSGTWGNFFNQSWDNSDPLRWIPAPAEVVLYESPNSFEAPTSRYPDWMSHFLAYARGAAVN